MQRDQATEWCCWATRQVARRGRCQISLLTVVSRLQSAGEQSRLCIKTERTVIRRIPPEERPGRHQLALAVAATCA